MMTRQSTSCRMGSRKKWGVSSKTMEKVSAAMIKNVYNGTETPVKDYQLVAKSRTVYIYERPKSKIRIYAARGTQDKKDVAAIGKLIRGQFASSSRYRDDKAFVQAHRAPPSYRTLGIGHSLGGAIVDQWLADGLISSGLSFNPAIELQHLRNSGNRRYYNRNDFLYKLVGQFASNVSIINDSLWDKLDGIINYFNLLKVYYAHGLDNFELSVREKKPTALAKDES